MEPYEIYNASFSWNDCEDVRPWLIVQVRPFDIFACLPIASECYGGSCFWISQASPDFAATGLTKSCHIHDSHIFDIPRAQFGKRRGALMGQLLHDFKQFSGL